MVAYAPHTLYVKRTSREKDEYNRTIGVSEEWILVGPCRCDDNSTAQIADDTGKAFIPSYHIVTNRCDIKAGDTIQALDGEEVRGQGLVRRVIKTNYLDYMSVYV